MDKSVVRRHRKCGGRRSADDMRQLIASTLGLLRATVSAQCDAQLSYYIE